MPVCERFVSWFWSNGVTDRRASFQIISSKFGVRARDGGRGFYFVKKFVLLSEGSN